MVVDHVMEENAFLIAEIVRLSTDFLFFGHIFAWRVLMLRRYT